MQSQEDIFATQTQALSQSQSQSQTQSQSTTSKKPKYDFLVLCDQDENVQEPFGLFPRAIFSESEIQDKWLDSILDHSSRLKSLQTLERLPGFRFSLFGKIEEGIYIYKSIYIYIYIYIKIYIYSLSMKHILKMYNNHLFRGLARSPKIKSL